MKYFYRVAVWRELWKWFKTDLSNTIIIVVVVVFMAIFGSLILFLVCGDVGLYIQTVFLKAILVLGIWWGFYLSICFILDLVRATKKVKDIR